MCQIADYEVASALAKMKIRKAIRIVWRSCRNSEKREGIWDTMAHRFVQ